MTWHIALRLVAARAAPASAAELLRFAVYLVALSVLRPECGAPLVALAHLVSRL